MKIFEVSRGERRRQRAEKARTSYALPTQNSDELRRELRRARVAQQLKPIEKPPKKIEEPSGFLANPELAQYYDDDSDEQGVYLNFAMRRDPNSKQSTMWAYWSKSGVQNIDTVEPYGQVLQLGNSPISQSLINKIKELIGQYGYVHLYVSNDVYKVMPYQFKVLVEYLRQVYPEDTSDLGIEIETRPISRKSVPSSSVSTTTTKIPQQQLHKYEADLVGIFRRNPELSAAFRSIPSSRQHQTRNELLNIVATYSPDTEDAIPEIKTVLGLQ